MERKIIMLLTAVLLLLPMNSSSQTYQQLWKQVGEAQKKDLPKTAIQHLQTIQAKAQKDRAYGHLLKATLLHSRLQSEVAPDSLQPAVRRLEQQMQTVSDKALEAVYATVLSKVYADNRQLGDDHDGRSQDYLRLATAHPELLAKIKADQYAPFVMDGKDSEAFDGDLLSVIGYELEAWQWMQDYYQQAGNRRALCHLALRTAKSIQAFDSLSALYADLPEAAVIAKKRQNLWTVQSNPTFQTEIPRRVFMPQESQTIRLHSLRNIRQITMRVYRTSLKGDTQLNPEDGKDFSKIKTGMTELKDLAQTLNFQGHAEDAFFEDSLTLAGLPLGVYLIAFSSPQTSTTSRVLCFVSGLQVMTQAMPQETMRYVVVDARTGQPVPRATMRLEYYSVGHQKRQEEKLVCNEQGEVVVAQSRRHLQAVYVSTPSDVYCPSVESSGRYIYYQRQYNQEHIQLFTDRSIYRPGQTVQVAAIVWKEQSALEQQAVSDKSMTIVLRDANYKVVAEHEVTTDRFGKCSTTFTLPKGLLNGRFSIRAQSAATSISVEEYKRPTFQVEFPDYQQSYQQGDTVRAQGRALSYAGVPVQDAKVHYVVRRRVAYWWMAYSWYWGNSYMGRGLQEAVVKEGDVRTADDGTFLVEMPMILPDDLNGRSMFYHFVVEADVTDVAGESHHGSMMLPLGSKPTALTCSLPQQVRSDALPQVTFTRCNAAGKEIAGLVRYRLDSDSWKTCDANAPFTLFAKTMKSGEHRLQAVCEQDTIHMRFVVFGLDDEKPATTTHDWFYVSHTQFPADGSPVTLQVGSSDADLHIVYGIYAGNEVVESGAVRRSGELLNRKFTYRESYGNGLLLAYAWVKDGKCYTHRQTITRPMPEKKLHLSWETFRDRLTPGQQEEWRLHIQKPDGTPAEASLMAVLYDKSLDQIREHQWAFSPVSYLSQPNTRWGYSSWGSLHGSSAYQYKLLEIPSFSYSHFDKDVFPYYHYDIFIRGSRRLLGAAPMSAKMASTGAVANEAVEKNVMMVKSAVAMDEAVEVPEEGKQQETVQLRENLNETAFCYPALETDQQGGVSLKFTLPESLTTWRFMGVAHTTDMLYGTIGAEAVASKAVMVQPNIPRFLRMGDDAQIAARLFNTGEKTVCGQAKLVLLKAEDQTVVTEQTLPFTVEAGQTASVAFSVPCSSFQESLLICKVLAVGDDFSDGEQHYLPVLPDCERVTKTIPFTQHEPGVKRINLTSLFPQGTTQQKLTVEYTNNPAWLMVQALPVIGQPWEHSAIDQAASYYSNLLAKTLLAQSPQVKNVFEQWQRESGQEQSLQSQLQKDEELKDLVLTETPWVGEADRETEQKQRLADFFDENGIRQRLSTAVGKLGKLQNADGSFSWYPGMEGSLSITVAVEEMLVRLNQMAGEQQETRKLQNKAFDFIGQEMKDLVAELKKQEKKGHKLLFPSFTALRWLYLCALDGRQLPADVKAANDYLVKLLKKDIKRQTIYEKALTTVVLAKRNETKQTAEYVQSLKEYTVYTEEMGRYYDTPRAAYSWYDYKIPTEVAAIEAIQLVTPQDAQTIDEMRRWLLLEKRTQAWDTPINSVNAIFAFLMNQQSLLTTKTQTSLAIDQQPLEVPEATAGIGYVKTVVAKPQGQIFTATKESQGTSWGAVYAQYMQKTSDITASQSGITVRRELLAPNGALSLRKGDRLRVRITIETTRDLDFVQVVDRRAACMEPVRQLSGYQRGAYVSPKDAATHYYYSGLAKGKHVIETEYYIDRAGRYETGTCSVQCAYAPEYRATAPSLTLNIKE